MVRPLVRSLVFLTFASTAAAQSPPASTAQSESPSLAGIWVLTPALTERPQEIGFNRDWARNGEATGASGRSGGRSGGGGGHRGGYGGGGMGAPAMSRESAEDSTRVEQLTE